MSARRSCSGIELLRLCGLFLGVALTAPVFADTAAPQYDLNGNLRETQVPGGTLSYGYDALDRLKTEFGPGVDQTFHYDANGNRTSDATNIYAIAPNGNRLQAINGVTVIYDPAGHLLDDGRGKTFAYNAAGRLKEVRVNNVLVASYKYNFRGQRTHKITPQGTTLYHYDSQGHLIQTTDAQGAPKQSLHWADDQPIAQVDHTSGGDRIVYLHTDPLNTPRSATDANQTVVWRWVGGAFGETLPNEDPDGDGTLTTVNLRYAGQYFDAETGLHYNWNRYYDPKVGRYITSDPIGLAGGLNSYAYVQNNPLRWIDPKGLMGNAPGHGPYPPHQGPGAGIDDIAGNIAEMFGGKRELTGCYITCIAANSLTCGVVTGGSGVTGFAAGRACTAALNRMCFKKCGPQACSSEPEDPSVAPYIAP